jgi:hypothetical protein
MSIKCMHTHWVSPLGAMIETVARERLEAEGRKVREAYVDEFGNLRFALERKCDSVRLNIESMDEHKREPADS